MPADSSQDICRRIARLRLEVAGPRGRAQFARQLDLPASTYAYYEDDRIPPADVLVRIADLAGVNLRWLITGETVAEERNALADPALRRAARLLADCPDAAKPLMAFCDVLAETYRRFPSRSAAPQPPAEAREPTGEAVPSPPVQPTAEASEDIPIVGRTAAGLAAFWKAGQRPEGLLDPIEQAATRPASGQAAELTPLAEGAHQATRTVELLTLPLAASGTVEFLRDPPLKARYADAFALRVDGDSMAPDFVHGDLVVLSPSAPARDGDAAVVQLAGQIGVTCKLFRREGDRIHLVPVNEQHAPQTYPADRLEWALAVLAAVRCRP